MQTYKTKATALRGASRVLAKAIPDRVEEIKPDLQTVEQEDGTFGMRLETTDTAVMAALSDQAVIDVVLKRASGYPPPGDPRRKSRVEKPVAVAWRIADEMVGRARKDVVAAMQEAGVAHGTSRAQFQRWRTRRIEEGVIGRDGQPL